MSRLLLDGQIRHERFDVDPKEIFEPFFQSNVSGKSKPVSSVKIGKFNPFFRAR